MSDWQKGDLALCVKQGDWTGNATGRRLVDLFPGIAVPVCGSVYTVAWAGLSRIGNIALEFVEVPTPQNSHGPLPWSATRFRKITPGTEPEGIEEPRRLPVKEKADA